MSKKSKWKIGLISAAAPTIISIALIAVIVTVYKEVSVMGNSQMQQKAENYEVLSKAAPKNATVFFGDSITELCSVEDIYSEYTQSTGVPVCNRGISSECTGGMLERIEESVIAIQPRNLVMLMGVNDLNQGVAKEQIINNVRQMITLVKKKSPQTNIILQAVYPTDQERKSLYERFQLNGRDNATIKVLNKMYLDLAIDEGITFVDVTDILADDSGNLRKEFTFDGLHPNAKGYIAVRDKIISALV